MTQLLRNANYEVTPYNPFYGYFSYEFVQKDLYPIWDAIIGKVENYLGFKCSENAFIQWIANNQMIVSVVTLAATMAVLSQCPQQPHRSRY